LYDGGNDINRESMTDVHRDEEGDKVHIEKEVGAITNTTRANVEIAHLRDEVARLCEMFNSQGALIANLQNYIKELLKC
jgi:hypothetical protein